MMDLSTTSPEGQPSPVKRSRLAISCEGCRGRKIKCNGGPAPCRHCAKLAIACEFREHARPERRKRSEAAAASGEAPAKRPRSRKVAESDDTREFVNAQDVDVQDEERDAVGIAGSSSAEFIGQSSIGALLNGFQPNQALSSASPPSPAPSTTRGKGSSTAKFAAEDFELPARDFADHLVANYFKFVHVLFPFLDEVEFEQYYRAAFENPRPKRPIQYSIINLVLSLGCHFVYREKVHPDGELFYARAAKLLLPYTLGLCQLPLVQAFLLITICIQTTVAPSDCWTTVGQAIRTAQGLGLHLDAKSTGDSRTQETRRRVWASCVIFDRMVASTWGRPTMIEGRFARNAQFAVQLPVPEVSAPVVATSSVDCFNQLFALFLMIDSALTKIYPLQQEHPTAAAEQLSIMSSLVSCQHEFQEWLQSLPDPLRWCEGWVGFSEEQKDLAHQRVWLHGLYLNYTLVLHRPSIDVARRTMSPLTVESAKDCSIQVTLASARACVATCVEVINWSKANRQAITLNGWWWYDTAFIFSSACVLLAVETASPQSWARQCSLMGPTELDALGLAIEMLDQTRHRGRNIDVSYRALNAIRESHSLGTEMPSLAVNLWDNAGGGVPDADLTRFFLEFESSGPDLRTILDDPLLDSANSNLFFGATTFDPLWV